MVIKSELIITKSELITNKVSELQHVRKNNRSQKCVLPFILRNLVEQLK